MISRLFSRKNSIKLKVIILILLCLFLGGCQNNSNEQINKNIYELNTDTTLSEYIPLSNMANDYYIPDFKDHSWGDWKFIEEESRYRIHSNGSKFYILRQTSLNDDTYQKAINGKEIVDCLNKQIKSYVGIIDENSYKVDYTNNLKFYISKGCVGTEYYFLIGFQSKALIPSVSEKRIPTILLMKYKDKEETSHIEEMFKTFREWMIYME